MNFERMFRTTMTEMIAIAPRASLNDYGEGVPGPAKTYTAWINRNPRERRSGTAEVAGQGIRAAVYLGGRVETDGSITDLADLTTPTADDLLTLPDGSQPPIVEVRELRDPAGDRHVVLIL